MEKRFTDFLGNRLMISVATNSNWSFEGTRGMFFCYVAEYCARLAVAYVIRYAFGHEKTGIFVS